MLIVSRETTIAFYSAVISAVAIVAVFFEQRMAKDYAGAAMLVGIACKSNNRVTFPLWRAADHYGL
jgi:hypothetical protein